MRKPLTKAGISRRRTLTSSGKANRKKKRPTLKPIGLPGTSAMTAAKPMKVRNSTPLARRSGSRERRTNR